MVAPLLTSNQLNNPYVEVFPLTFLPGTERFSVERVSEGRTWPVRGGLNITTGRAVLDFEIPFCVPVTYRVECFGADGTSLGYGEQASTTLWETRTIVHQPLDPQLWVSVKELAGTAETIVRPFDSELVKIEGSGIPRAIGAGKRGVDSMPYTMMVETAAEADVIQAMLGTEEKPQFPVLCIRTPPPMRIPRTFFAHVPELPERWISPGSEELFSYSFNATEVEPPFAGLATPLLTYYDLDAAFGSYALMDAAFSSYTDRDRAYYLAGTA